MEKRFRAQSNQDGAAFVEALVTIPAFAVVLAGVLGIHAMYNAKLEAKARARRVAWLQADSGQCPERTCAGSACDAMQTEIGGDALTRLHTTGANRFSLSSFVDGVGRFLVGTVADGYGTARTRTPRMIGSGLTVQHGRMTLLCNATPARHDPGQSIVEHACETRLRSTEYANEVCP